MIPATVIMSVYREDPVHLRLAIESILSQTFRDFEYIIVLDDPKNAELDTIIQEYEAADARIIYKVNDVNRGLSYCRNIGIRMASGNIVVLMDADDVSLPDRLAVQIGYLEQNPQCSIVTSSTVVIDEDGRTVRNNIIRISDEAIPDVLEIRNFIMNPASAIRKNVFHSIGEYRFIPCAEDYDFWLRCCSEGIRFHCAEEPLYLYRERQASISHQNAAKSFYYSDYVKTLYEERKRNGRDSYSEESVKKLAHDFEILDFKKTEKFNKAFAQYLSALLALKNGRIISLFSLLACFFREPGLWPYLFESIKIHQLTK